MTNEHAIILGLVLLTVVLAELLRRKNTEKVPVSEPIDPPDHGVGHIDMPSLPVLKFSLRRGMQGPEVEALQKSLKAQGYDLGSYGVDGDYGADTEKAVKKFEQKNELTVDGICGPEVWEALGGVVDMTVLRGKALREKLASYAESEASRNLKWSGPTSEAEKYLEPFRGPMQKLGQIRYGESVL